MDGAVGREWDFWASGGDQLAYGRRSQPHSSRGGGVARRAVHPGGHDAGYLYAGSFCAAGMNSDSVTLLPHAERGVASSGLTSGWAGGFWVLCTSRGNNLRAETMSAHKSNSAEGFARQARSRFSHLLPRWHKAEAT